MACGTPVAAYGRGGLNEIVTPDSGRLATSPDVAALARAIDAAATCDRDAVRATCRAGPWTDADGRRVRGTVPAHRGRGRGVIGYYVHHVGPGHLNRARAVALRAEGTVTGLSSLPAPADWPGPWVRLARDDERPRGGRPDRGGNLHWVPERDDGLCRRMAALSSWIETARPDVLVSDVSAEVALLARLHGVPVVSVVLPGRRGDRAHRSAYAVSSGLVAAWPREAAGMVHGLAQADAAPAPRRSPLAAGDRRPGPARPESPPGPRPVRPWRWPPHRGPAPSRRRPTHPTGPGRCWAGRGSGGRPVPRPSTRPRSSWSRPVRVRWPTSPRGDAPLSSSRPPPVRRAAGHGPGPGRGPVAVPRGGALPRDGLDRTSGRGGRRWTGRPGRSWCDGGAADRLAEYLASFSSPRRRRIA